MANTIITPEIIAKLAAMNFKNYTGMSGRVNRSLEKEFKKIGTSVNVRQPVKFRAKSGATIDSVNVVEREKLVTISEREHVAWDFTSLELTTSIEKYNERYIKPATIALANKCDVVGHELYKKIYNTVGAAGTGPSTFAHVAEAAKRLANEATPREMRYGSLDPTPYYDIAGNLTTLNNVDMSTKAYTHGIIPNVASFDLAENQNCASHTVGLHSTGSTGIMAGATAEGATELATDGWAVSTAILYEGDNFTIPNVYAVNPVSGISTGVLRMFVVTADVVSDGAGLATIPIDPIIYSAAATEDYLPYQTVTALPADSAALTVHGTESASYTQNMFWQKDAFTLVTIPLILPDSCNFKARVDEDNLSIRVVKDFDIINDKEIIRLDIQFGWDTLYPEMAVRYPGAF